MAQHAHTTYSYAGLQDVLNVNLIHLPSTIFKANTTRQSVMKTLIVICFCMREREY